MIKKIEINNFTGFKKTVINFSGGLNIIIGENGAGKSNLLRLPYVLTAVSAEEYKKRPETKPTKILLQPVIAEKFISVFRPETLGRLVKRKQGREKCEIDIRYDNSKFDLRFAFASNSKTEVEIDRLPSSFIDKTPVFIPTRELLSIYPGFVSLYEQYHLEFEETWRDTSILLGAPVSKGPREKTIKDLLAPLEKAMGGNIIMEGNGRFYLSMPGKGKMEIPLVAEGIRKIAMLARLIATGQLLDQGYLFWDEPESNLNPKYIKTIAQTIVSLAGHGIQIFVATHSLFFLKEIEILLSSSGKEKHDTRYVGLNVFDEDFYVEQGTRIEDLSVITSLEEELKQSDRFMESEFGG